LVAIQILKGITPPTDDDIITEVKSLFGYTNTNITINDIESNEILCAVLNLT
jgi:hypothetical protein